MTPSPTPVSITVRDGLASSYEDLRRLALADHGHGVGLALFIRSGMARWMEVCIELLDRPSVLPPPPRQVAEQHQRVHPATRVEMAMVLAQMVLSSHAQGATTC